MISVPLNERELHAIDMVRMALSEETNDERLESIRVVKLDVASMRLEELNDTQYRGWQGDSRNTELIRWVTDTSSERHEAAIELAVLDQRFQRSNQRALNVAEEVGFFVRLSIRDGRYQGVQTKGGLIEQVTEIGRGANVRGAKDHDTVRKAWMRYRGVVHLGLALNEFEERFKRSIPKENLHELLFLAEEIRVMLSETCPKGWKDPYVPQEEQISFVYKSSIYGPRFLNRGLPFDVKE